MFVRDFRPGDEEALHDVFYSSIHGLASKDYTPEQLDAWAPSQLDIERWTTRMRGIRPRLRALRWALLPSHAYLDGWRHEHGLPAAGYVMTLAHRFRLNLRYLLGQVLRRGRKQGG